jgi:hypothetical protein
MNRVATPIDGFVGLKHSLSFGLLAQYYCTVAGA